jgi:hypothetical protein
MTNLGVGGKTKAKAKAKAEASHRQGGVRLNAGSALSDRMTAMPGKCTPVMIAEFSR